MNREKVSAYDLEFAYQFTFKTNFFVEWLHTSGDSMQPNFGIVNTRTVDGLVVVRWFKGQDLSSSQPIYETMACDPWKIKYCSFTNPELVS